METDQALIEGIERGIATGDFIRWKPGASRRERSSREHGKWVTRPYGLRARDTRTTDKHIWKIQAEQEQGE
jgi:hypothetical protein